MSERIAAAAILVDGQMYTVDPPGRHRQVMDHMQIVGVNPNLGEQGFATDKARFVTRWQAYRIAERAGQLIRPRRRSLDAECFSEDLW